MMNTEAYIIYGQPISNRALEMSLSLYEYKSEVDAFREATAKKIEDLKELMLTGYVNSVRAGLPQYQRPPLPAFMRGFVPKHEIDTSGVTLRYDDELSEDDLES